MPRPSVVASVASLFAGPASFNPGVSDVVVVGLSEVGTDPQAPPDNITWGGVTATSLVAGTPGVLFARNSRLGYAAPGSGVQAISTTDPQAAACRGFAGLSLAGVQVGIPFAASVQAFAATTTSASVPVTVTADQRVVFYVFSAGGAANAYTGTGVTTIHAQDQSGTQSVAIGSSTGDITFTSALSADHLILYTVVEGTSGTPTPSLYLGSALTADGLFRRLDATAPGTATIPVGATVVGVPVGHSARVARAALRSPGDFGATLQPSGAPDSALGDGWRTDAPLNGTFAGGTVTLQLPLIAVNAEGANVRARFDIWKSANADMSSATRITTATIVGSTLTNLQSEAAAISTGTAMLGPIVLSNEFLMIQAAIEVTA